MAADVLTLTLVLVLLSSAASVPAEEIRECLKRFSLANTDFDTCKKRPCFIFLRQEPYIVLNEDVMQKIYANRTVVFDCKDTGDIPGLGGTTFEFIRRTAASNAACVWGGPECLFNDLVDFIDNSAQNNATGMYQFAATGLFLENSHRERKHLFQSISLQTEELVIFGVDSRRPTRKPFPFMLVLQPFTPAAWASFLVWLFIVAVSEVCAAYTFGPRPFCRRSLLIFVVHGYPDFNVACTSPPPTGGETENQFMKRVDRRIKNCNFARKLTRLELSLIIVVFLLWYEYGLAKVLFVEQRKPSLKDVSKLTREDLELYSIEGNSAAEDTWNRTVFGDGTKYNETTIPWHRSSKESNYFDWILAEKKYQRDYPHWRKKRRLEFIVGFKSTGTYQVLRRGACERMTIFRTEPNLAPDGFSRLPFQRHSALRSTAILQRSNYVGSCRGSR